MRLKIIILFASIFVLSCGEEISDPQDASLEDALLIASGGQGKDYFLLPSQNELSQIPQDPKNPLSSAKVELGKHLFHETAIGTASNKTIGRSTYSCSSCHIASAGFQSGLAQGIGEGGIGFGVNGEGRYKGSLYNSTEIDVQLLRAPATLNVAFQKNVLWSGKLGATDANIGTENFWQADSLAQKNILGFEGIETQAIAGLEFHRMNIDKDFIENSDYKSMFDAVYSDDSLEERYSNINASLAIAAYVRTITSNESPFQRWLKGNSKAMTSREKEGAILFFGKAACADCHNGPGLNNMEFHALGMDDFNDGIAFINSRQDLQNASLGRGGFTNRTEDMFKFKVPQLYNLLDAPFYGHGSSFESLRAVIEYKNKAQVQKNIPSSNLSEAFEPLNLSTDEIEQIYEFLAHALYDNNLERYLPTSTPSGNCFPNNDPLSKQDLNCGF